MLEFADYLNVNVPAAMLQAAACHRSTLGNLIADAKSNPWQLNALDSYLKSVADPESVFHNVCRIEGDGEDQTATPAGFNALEYAIACRLEKNNTGAVPKLLDTLTKYFHHPAKHLNLRTARGPPLHLAVQQGDARAVFFLLERDEVDAGRRNAEGWTAFDVCLLRWQDSTRDRVLADNEALESSGLSRAKAEKQWETDTKELMRVFHMFAASEFGAISFVVKRLSAEELLVIGVDEQRDYGMSKMSQEGKNCPFVPERASSNHDFVYCLDVLSDFSCLYPGKIRQSVENLKVGEIVRLLNRGPRKDFRWIRGYLYHEW